MDIAPNFVEAATAEAAGVPNVRFAVHDVQAAGFEDVSVEFTHRVADGMHAAIVKAVKPEQPEQRRLPVVVPAARAGCC